MDIAIVTGASSSLGLAISGRLIQLGFRVYGLGGDYKDCPLNNVNFRPMPCDLSDPAAVEASCEKILEVEKGVYLIVNNAKYFGRNAFLDMETPEIERILRINLLCPLILVRTLAESLKSLQGYLIQLGAPYSETSGGGAAGAAASGGLKWMGEVLFHELRDHGVKVCHLSPEPNRGRDTRRKGHPEARPEAVIDPEAVAQAVEQILLGPFGNVVTEMVLRPLRKQEPQQDPVRKLPYPEPQPIPYTVPREFIEAEEQLEEDDWQKEQDRKRKRSKAKKVAKKKALVDKEPAKPARKPAKTQKKSAKPAKDRPAKAATKPPAKEAEPQSEPAKSRRKSRRKPRPPRAEVGFLPTPDKEAVAASDSSPVKTETVKSEPARAKKKHARKKVAQKTPAKVPVKARISKKEDAPERPAKKRPARKATKKVAAKRSPKKVAKTPDNGKDSA
jgi:hypothetical protein